MILFGLLAVTIIQINGHILKVRSVNAKQFDNVDFSSEPIVTETTTVDVYRTLTTTYFNSVPITITNFVKQTVTAYTTESILTPVNNAVSVLTTEVSRPTTVTVTDISTEFICSVDINTEIFTITHTLYDIQQTTVTSTVILTNTFLSTFTYTAIQTESSVVTETLTVTSTVQTLVV